MRHGTHQLTRKLLLFAGLIAQVLFPRFGPCSALSQKSSPSIRPAQDDTLRAALKALQTNRLDEALTRLTVAEREQPSDARIRNFRGIVLVRLGRNIEAADEYRESIRLDPNLEDAYKNLGFLEWTEHRLESARPHLQRALELAPGDSFAHYYLGRVQLDAAVYESAFQELDRSGISWPTDAQFLIEAATGGLALGRQELARKAIDGLSTMRLSDSEVAIVARLMLSAGDNASAVGLLRVSAGKNAAGARWAGLDLALSYLMAGNYEKAARQSQAFLDAPQSAGTPAEAACAWSTIGIAKARLGQGSVAVHAFRQAAMLDAHREEHWLNLTRELMELDRFTEAISAAEEGLKSNPKSYALHLRLGAAYLSSDRYSEAESVFRKLVDAGDPLPTSYVGLAQVLMRTGRAQEAVADLDTAGKKLGANFLISYFQGLALDRVARPAEAVSAFQEAIRLNPNSSEAQLGLGKAELAVGHTDTAIVELQKSLQLNPGNLQAQRLLAQAYRRAGDTQASSRSSEQIAETEAAPQIDLLGDFNLPEWQTPQESAGH